MKLRLFLVWLILCSQQSFAAYAQELSFNTSQIETITGLAGKLNPEEKVFKVTLPRREVNVTVDQIPWDPFMGLTSWVGFTPGQKSQAMIMGDLVLFQDEVNPVMARLLESGLEVTALHNHFFYDEPRVYFMHISGEGRSLALAKALRRGLDEMKRIRQQHPQPQKTFGFGSVASKNQISPSSIEKILGAKGQSQDGMFKVVLGRKAKMTCNCAIGKDMGVNTWAAFAGTDQKAVVAGDFAMLESELQSVLKSLRKSQIQIVAIHNHMTGEEPRYVFLHYWGVGPAKNLAQALKKAVRKQGKY